MAKEKMTHDKIVEIFESDMYDNDVNDKISHIMSENCKYSYEELLEIYDNMYENTHMPIF